MCSLTDNTNTTSPYGPDQNIDEDRIEQRAGLPGRYVLVNDDDDDQDGILDHDDGYNKDAGIADDDVTYKDASHKEDDFVMLKVKIEPSSIKLDPNKAWVYISYLASSPDPNVHIDGKIRLWKKPGYQARDKRPALPNYYPGQTGQGDWIVPGEYKDLSQLMPGNGSPSHEMTFYIEGVAASQALGDAWIEFKIDPDGEGTAADFVHMDVVQVTVIKLDLDVDTNRDGTTDESDDPSEDTWMIQRGAIALYNCDDDNQETGSATADSTTPFRDSSKHWVSDQWANGYVTVTDGPWRGWRARVFSNTEDTLNLTSWQPSAPPLPSPPSPPATFEYKVFDGVDADTSWVDGPDDRSDMAQLAVRPMPTLAAGYSVFLRARTNVALLRIWADEDIDHDRHLDEEEDLNHNGVLDPGEDIDQDGRLDMAEDFNGSTCLDTEETDVNANGELDQNEDLNDNNRFDHIGALVVGQGQETPRDITSLARAGATLYLEALSFPTETIHPLEFDIDLELRSPSSAILAIDTVRLRTAPWLMIPATQWAQKVLVVEMTGLDGNTPFVTAIETLCGPGNVMRINGPAYCYGQGMQDRWIQDQIEIGYTQAPYKTIHVSLESPRFGTTGDGLSPFGKHELLGSDFGFVYCPGGAPDSTVGFGNLEVSPPVTVSGHRYHLGRIVHGQIASPSVVAWLEAQEIQHHFEVNLSFLATKHIDEVFSFMAAPGETTRQGFRLLVASPERARTIMQGLVDNGCADSPLAEPPVGDDLYAIGSLLTNATTRANWEPQNVAAWAGIVAARGTLKDQLDLDPATDFLPMPLWFEDERHGRGLVAYSANVVNGLWPNPSALIIPDTFGPLGPFGADEFLAGINADFDATGFSSPQPVDDWLWYHMEVGEVHCGTNAVRAIPSQPWWSPD